MKILVLSKEEFENLMKSNGINNNTVELYEDTFFISIHHNGVKETYFENKKNVKVMFFDDCTFKLENATPMNADQADELLNFIDENLDKKTCIVHCAAGISRSGAIGTFLCDYTESDFDVFVQTNPHIHPNVLVLNLMKKAVGRKHNLRMY